MWINNSNGSMYWTGSIEPCNNQTSTIENYELAKVLSNGIYANLQLKYREKDDLETEEVQEKIYSNKIMLKLQDLKGQQELIRKAIKNLKWYQPEGSYIVKIMELDDEATKIAINEVSYQYKWYVEDVSSAINYLKYTLQSKYTKHNWTPSQETILAILLSTPDFKTKSFKELIEIVNNQTK